MRIFVTGGTGFIGSHFIQVALAAGHEVIATSCPQHLKNSNRLYCVNKRLADIQKQDLINCDVVAHFAAYGVSPKKCCWQTAFDVNVTQSLRLLELSTELGIPRFVAAGSYAEYGKAGLRYDKIPADAPLEPTDPYAASKAASSIAMASFARNRNTQLFYGRIFSAYGDGQFEQNFWPQLRKAALAGKDFEMTLGQQIRDFIPVEQVAKIFLTACDTINIENGTPSIVNVASGSPVSLAEFANKWWEFFNATGKLKIGATPYRDNEVMRYIADI
jgi:UDP-glucose 4-epimerase